MQMKSLNRIYFGATKYANFKIASKIGLLFLKFYREMFLRRKKYIFIVLYELNEIASWKTFIKPLYNLLYTLSLPELYHEYVYHVSNIFTQITYLDKQFQHEFDINWLFQISCALASCTLLG